MHMRFKTREMFDILVTVEFDEESHQCSSERKHAWKQEVAGLIVNVSWGFPKMAENKRLLGSSSSISGRRKPAAW